MHFKQLAHGIFLILFMKTDLEVFKYVSQFLICYTTT